MCLNVETQHHLFKNQPEADLWSFLSYALPPPDNTLSVCLCDTHTHNTQQVEPPDNQNQPHTGLYDVADVADEACNTTELGVQEA